MDDFTFSALETKETGNDTTADLGFDLLDAFGITQDEHDAFLRDLDLYNTRGGE